MIISLTRLSTLFLAAGVGLVLAGCGAEEPASESPSTPIEQQPTAQPQLPEGGYTISIGAITQGDNVELVIETNIPGVVEVMASVDLKGQAANDVYIGKTERVRVVDGKGSTSISANDLPSGEYEAGVSFYPRWGFQDELSRSTGIAEDLEDSHDITLRGTGESATKAQDRENSQKWVMANVISGYAWKETEWTERFGEYDELPIERFNPEIMHAYYFPGLDMTIFVNTFKNEVSHWRVGKANQ